MNGKDSKFENDSELISSNLNVHEKSRVGPHGLGSIDKKKKRN